MKKYIYLWTSLFVLSTSCNKVPEYFELVAPTDQMEIQTSENNIILELAKADEQVIGFSWNTATPRREGSRISYCFRLYEAENKNNITEIIDLGADTQSFSYTHQELNEILKSWNKLPDSKINLMAQVIARVDDSKVYMKPEITTVGFTVIGYDNELVSLMKTRQDSFLSFIAVKRSY